MDTADIEAQVEDLSSNIDDLEEALAPLLKTALSTSASKLPLLDKAKLYVHATYAIESILFSALRLNGVDAKSHPIFQELNRVKEYFAKIKTAETAGTKRSTTVDKVAAGRFIKQGLAGNEKYDRERAERVAREQAGAKRKFQELAGGVGTHTRFDGAAKRLRAEEDAVAVVRASSLDDEDVPVTSDNANGTSAQDKEARRAAKRQRRLERRLAEDADGASSTDIAQEGQPRDTMVHYPGSESTNEALAALSGSLHQAETKRVKKKKRKSRGETQQELEDKRANEMK
ncbi:hypothetical protein BAUCODRAFT_32044 [Baudoinia panamericana UAMH 10762]|uniref:Exosome complex protein n=1 Tax=Baudoinia panamericana (strain UAMH 10762) TaxID=717646 RepID=M2N2A2_BAUPA|nr:uncharacterized protein BAUCODRAFT_32044 [Baudoinia panamericana UAMH 10762]EMC98038.1 hypothetical protein BAUCODRAFT_32044 [Baudoinia panamericana UAMH 10762]